MAWQQGRNVAGGRGLRACRQHTPTCWRSPSWGLCCHRPSGRSPSAPGWPLQPAPRI